MNVGVGAKLNPSFQLKNENCELLSIHHTIEEGGQIKRIRFVQVAINRNNDFLTAVDHRGNIFLFKLSSGEYWLLSVKVEKCSAVICFSDLQGRNVVFLGTKLGDLTKVKTIEKFTSYTVSAHQNEPITSLSTDSNHKFIAATAVNAIKVFNVKKLELLHTLNYGESPNSMVIFGGFIPRTDKILSVVGDNQLNVLTWNLKASKHMLLTTLYEKWRKVQKMEGAISPLVVQSVTISSDGNLTVVNCLQGWIILISNITWTITKVINLSSTTIVVNVGLVIIGSKEIFLCYATATNALLISNTDSGLLSPCIINHGNTNGFVISSNSQMLITIQKSGEVIVYNIRCLVDCLKPEKSGSTSRNVLLRSNNRPCEADQRLGKLIDEVQKTLPKSRLLPILAEYNHYPGKYRPLIWRTLLQLPQNSNAFMQLLCKGHHACVHNFDRLHPTVEQREMRSFKQLVSCLAHWSKIFSHCDEIGCFAYPFLRLYKNDSLLTFELVATILLNTCQLWYEYFPLEPFNYLGMIDNVLTACDPELADYFRRKGIAAKCYGGALMASAFSEVLEPEQWYVLWDHIVTNNESPDFFVFCVVAFSVMQRKILFGLTAAEVEAFFHEQSAIDMDKFMAKVYELQRGCAIDIHPGQYMKQFMPLLNGQYQQFTNYPKMLLEIRNNELDTLKSDEQLLQVKMRELEEMERKVNAKMQECMINEEHQKRMAELEKKYEDTLHREEERVMFQRKLLLMFQKQLRAKEKTVLVETRQSQQRSKVAEREMEMEMLLKHLERQRIREETDLLCAEDNLLQKEMLLEAQTIDMKNNCPIDADDSLALKFRNSSTRLACEKEKMSQEVNQTKIETLVSHLKAIRGAGSSKGSWDDFVECCRCRNKDASNDKSDRFHQ